MSIRSLPEGARAVQFRQAIETCGRSGRILGDAEAETRARDTVIDRIAETSPLVLRLRDTEEIRGALAHARSARISVHPVSSGHNWGYGTARPADAATRVIFDLSEMNRILQFDRRLGIITLEPGVTQHQLSTFLAGRGAEFMVPTTGAGPQCSVVGNALERGYGMTPVADHFQAVLGLSAILADGHVYRSPMLADRLSPEESGFPVYRWGVGPYLDGLFSQNGGAIVTEMTLQLIRRPQEVEMFVFWLDTDEQLQPAVDAVRNLLAGSGLMIGGVNLMNAARVAAMAGTDAVNGAAWIGTGVVYGDARVTRAGRKVITQILKPVSRRISFVNASRIKLLERVSSLPVLGRKLSPLVPPLRSAHRLLSGYPDEFALTLAYSDNREAMPEQGRDPARDGCGLLWYAPLVPILGEQAKLYVEMVTRVCAAHGFSAPITFSTLSIAGFDSTVPLVFSRDADNSARAMQCLRALISNGRALGFHPYRFHSALMPEATSGADDFWRLAKRLRAALDPEGTIAPGRYEPAPSQPHEGISA